MRQRHRLPRCSKVQQGAKQKEKAKPVKRSRETYGEGAGLEKMTTAVNDWLEKKGRYEEDVPMPMSRYCALVDIPEETFRKYVCTDPGKRRKLGSQPGPSRLVSKDASQFVVDVMRRKDRADDGMNRRESIDLLQDLQPELTRKDAVCAGAELLPRRRDLAGSAHSAQPVTHGLHDGRDRGSLPRRRCKEGARVTL
jgi:hypothetical protein